jgi:hypothetical protein
MIHIIYFNKVMLLCTPLLANEAYNSRSLRPQPKNRPIEINSSKTVMRDIKYHSVNSSTGPEVRDSPKNFVKPGKYSSGTFNSQWTIWLRQECSKEFWINAHGQQERMDFFTVQVGLNPIWTTVFAKFEPGSPRNKQKNGWETPEAKENCIAYGWPFEPKNST